MAVGVRRCDMAEAGEPVKPSGEPCPIRVSCGSLGSSGAEQQRRMGIVLFSAGIPLDRGGFWVSRNPFSRGVSSGAFRCKRRAVRDLSLFPAQTSRSSGNTSMTIGSGVKAGKRRPTGRRWGRHGMRNLWQKAAMARSTFGSARTVGGG